MVRYFDDSSVFDAPVEKVWKLIAAHSDANVHHIHASFVSSRTVEERAGAITKEVEMRAPDGKTMPVRMRFTPRPPHAQLVEFETGPFAGSWFTTAYVEEGAKTRLVVAGEFAIRGLDDASVLKGVDDFMSTGFAEDAAYLKKMA